MNIHPDLDNAMDSLSSDQKVWMSYMSFLKANGNFHRFGGFMKDSTGRGDYINYLSLSLILLLSL